MSGSEKRSANYLLKITVQLFVCGSAFGNVGPIESFCSAYRVPNSFPRGKKMSMFLDHAKVHVKAGKGGDGMVAFRREKSMFPMGGLQVAMAAAEGKHHFRSGSRPAHVVGFPL